MIHDEIKPTTEHKKQQWEQAKKSIIEVSNLKKHITLIELKIEDEIDQQNIDRWKIELKKAKDHFSSVLRKSIRDRYKDDLEKLTLKED